MWEKIKQSIRKEITAGMQNQPALHSQKFTEEMKQMFLAMTSTENAMNWYMWMVWQAFEQKSSLH